MLTLYHHQLPSVTISSTCGIPSWCCFWEATPLGLEAVVSEAFGIHPQCARVFHIQTKLRTEWRCEVAKSMCMENCMSLSSISFSMMNFPIFQMHVIQYGFKKIPSIGSAQPTDWTLHSPATSVPLLGPMLVTWAVSTSVLWSTRTLDNLKGLGACLVREAPRLPRLPRLLTSMSQQEATTFAPNSAREYLQWENQYINLRPMADFFLWDHQRSHLLIFFSKPMADYMRTETSRRPLGTTDGWRKRRRCIAYISLSREAFLTKQFCRSREAWEISKLPSVRLNTNGKPTILHHMSSFHTGDICFIFDPSKPVLVLTSRVQTVCCSKWLIFASTPRCALFRIQSRWQNHWTIDCVD